MLAPKPSRRQGPRASAPACHRPPSHPAAQPSSPRKPSSAHLVRPSAECVRHVRRRGCRRRATPRATTGETRTAGRPACCAATLVASSTTTDPWRHRRPHGAGPVQLPSWQVMVALDWRRRAARGSEANPASPAVAPAAASPLLRGRSRAARVPRPATASTVREAAAAGAEAPHRRLPRRRGSAPKAQSPQPQKPSHSSCSTSRALRRDSPTQEATAATRRGGPERQLRATARRVPATPAPCATECAKWAAAYWHLQVLRCAGPRDAMFRCGPMPSCATAGSPPQGTRLPNVQPPTSATPTAPVIQSSDARRPRWPGRGHASSACTSPP
mmetsp:Transcript_122661/g.392710  ORF Transcript_122661/g.392710 Transcript_122661/m.392710 type:complete len:329 (+) Transcript_122661:1192-2178(+)